MGKLIVSILNFFSSLTFPAVLTLVLLLVIFIFYRKRSFRYLLAITIILFYFAANGIIPSLLITPLENNLFTINKAGITDHRAMIVLGGGITQTKQRTTIGLLGYARIVEAAKIYQQALRQGHYTIVLSGGATSKNHATEAQLYQTALIQLGIPKKQMLLENNSKNTFENAKFVKPLLQQHHIKTALLVTSGLHMRRALQYFHYFKINITPAPADFPYPHVSWLPLAYNLTFTELALHEWYGIARLMLYDFFGLNH